MSDEVTEIHKTAREERPALPPEKIPGEINPAFRAPDGKLTARPDIDPTKHPKVHPLALGVREAKALINEILKKAENLEILRVNLEAKFYEDPVGFFLKFAPLLERYEALSSDGGEGAAVRLFVRGGETAVEISRREK